MVSVNAFRAEQQTFDNFDNIFVVILLIFLPGSKFNLTSFYKNCKRCNIILSLRYAMQTVQIHSKDRDYYIHRHYTRQTGTVV